MPASTRAPSHVQGFYSTMTGVLLREDGHTRPATMDEVQENYGEIALWDVMSTLGWVDLVTPGLWQPMPVVRRIDRAVAKINMDLFRADAKEAM